MVCQVLLNAGYTVKAMVLADSPNAAVPATFNQPTFNYHPCQGNRVVFVQKCIEAALKMKPALILVGHVNFSPLGYGLAQLFGAKWATFIYGIDAWHPLPLLRRLAVQQCDQIISISQFTAARAGQANGLPRQKIRILHNCISSEFVLDGKGQEQANNGRLSLLTVARMTLAEQYKGHDYVIRAIPILLRRFPNLVYNIVGDGDWQPALMQLVNELGISRHVIFHGRVSDKQLLQHYTDASLFIMPSQKEGFGFVFIEAMALGVPAVGGNTDAAPEVIVNGKTGYVVNPTSVEEIVTAVSKLLENPQLRQQMGAAAQQHVAQNFGFERFQQDLLAYLGELQPEEPALA